MMKTTRKILKMLSLITQIGITMLTSIFMCMFLGLFIDEKFSINLFIPFLLLGIAGGFRGVSILVRKAIQEGEESENDKKKAE